MDPHQLQKIAPALLKAQIAVGAALKSSTNPYFKSSYADLTAVIEAVKEPLNENDIVFLQLVQTAEDCPLIETASTAPDGTGVSRTSPAYSSVVETILLHSSGEQISTLTPVFCNKPNDPQAFGSGITYVKRYALQAILGLPTEDDDGNEASAPAKPPKKQKKKDSPAIAYSDRQLLLRTTILNLMEAGKTVSYNAGANLHKLEDEAVPSSNNAKGLACKVICKALTAYINTDNKYVTGIAEVAKVKDDQLERAIERATKFSQEIQKCSSSDTQ